MGRKKAGSPRVAMVIPVRGADAMLQRTIDCARAGAVGPVEVIVVDNGYTGEPVAAADNVRVIGSGCGTGQARHAGVMAARAPLVVTVDAHVRLCEMWDDYVVDQFSRKGWSKTVACGFVGALKHDFMPQGEPHYKGARMHWVEESGGEVRPLAAKWCDAGKFGGKIGAVMGAFYAFRKKWYVEIGEPWSVFSSWGCDEELISLASWLSGGDCRLMAQHIKSWHLFSRPEAVPYADWELAEIRANRFRLLRMMPVPVDVLERFARIYPGMYDASLNVRQLDFAKRFAGEGRRMADYLRDYVEGYAQWQVRAEQTAVITIEPECRRAGAAAAVVAQAAAAVVPAAAPKTAQVLPKKPVDRCDRCEAVDSFVCYKTSYLLRKYRCKHCGRKAYRRKDDAEIMFNQALLND
jgi:glycosyltransferase involved in cell wall biosynthesis